jgi:flagellar brake protein
MPTIAEELSLPDFEIDHPDVFAQFLLSDRREIVLYLTLLAKRRSIFTAYLNEGQRFFLTSIVAVDESGGMIYFDQPDDEANNTTAQQARQVTMVTNLDRIKIQIRLATLTHGSHQNQKIIGAPIPQSMLRLQRREFFRLEPPVDSPIHCKLGTQGMDGTSRTFELPLADISGGGVSLCGPTEIVNYFPRDALFPNCRLEIPDEGVIQVTLRVRKTVEMSGQSGHHDLRIGCEFVNLPAMRLAFIERYITRIERERKAKDSGLTD